MVRTIAVRLSKDQAKALLLSKLFNGKSPMSLHAADGVLANTACAPALVEEGRSFWKRPRTRLLLPPNGRVRFVRSLMGGSGDLLLEWYDKEKKSPSPVRFEARFDEPGSIHGAHQVLLMLKSVGVHKVAVLFAGYTSVVEEVCKQLHINPYFVPEDEHCDAHALLMKIREWHAIREEELAKMPEKCYTLRAHLAGLSNRVGA